MRKIYLLLAFLCFSHLSNATGWLDIGLKGAWGPNWLFNQKIMDSQKFNNQLSYGYAFGGKIGLNFNDFHEITFDVMASTFNQKFAFNIDDTATGASPLYNKSFTYKALDLILLYRLNRDGRYSEIGPSYTIVQSASGTNNYDEAADGVIKDNFVKSYVSLVFGFGAYFIGTDNFGITFGARFAYTFNDLISAQGHDINYPTNSSFINDTKSHPFTAMLVMEANLDFAYMVKASCKNKRKLLLF